MTEHVTRRTFLKTTLAGGVAAGVPCFVPASVFGAEAPSNRVNIGCIGTGHQGWAILHRFLRNGNAQVVAVCDINTASYGYSTRGEFRGRKPAQAAVNAFYAKKYPGGKYKGCDAYTDFRDVLARKDIDAVTVVTPDHWHALMTIAAAKAGKDIYCEKPLSLTIDQGKAMVEAVRRYQRVVQTGSHERSNPIVRYACELVRNGRIGQLKKITTYVGFNNFFGPSPGWKPMPVPEGFDYDTWLGPAPAAPYHKDRCFYRFRFNYDYAGGQVINYGAHSNDMAQWAMDADNTGPVEVECLEAKFLPEGSLFNTAIEVRTRCRYANDVELTCETNWCDMGIRFEGTEGMIEKIGFKGIVTRPASLATSEIGPNEVHLYRSDNHVKNFLDCVKNRKDPVASVEAGHRSASVCHLANIAIRLSKKGNKKALQWDPKQERFTNDDDANAMLSRPTCAPWQLG